MAKKQNEEQAILREILRRQLLLMAAAEGVTQTALQDRLVTEHWRHNYQGGPLDEVLSRQLDGG